MQKINLGSADRRVAGWLNADIRPGPNVDIVVGARAFQIDHAAVQPLKAGALRDGRSRE